MVDLDNKEYKIILYKNYLKHQKLLFFCQSFDIPETNVNQILAQHNLKKLNLKNKIFFLVFKQSIFYRFRNLVTSHLGLLKLKSIDSIYNLNEIQKDLSSDLTILCFKLNRKIYSTTEVKFLNVLNYLSSITLFVYNLIVLKKFLLIKTFFKKNTMSSK